MSIGKNARDNVEGGVGDLLENVEGGGAAQRDRDTAFQKLTHSIGQMDRYALFKAVHCSASSPLRCWQTRNSLKRVLLAETRSETKSRITKKDTWRNAGKS